MKTLGRIILLAAGGFMLFSAIMGLIAAIDGIKSANGWQAFIKGLMDSQTRGQYIQYLTALLKSAGLCIVAFTAVLAGLKGRGGFWFSVFSLVILGMFIWDVVAKTKGGAFAGDNLWKAILQLIIDSIAQIGYILGFIILKLSKDK